MPLKLTEVDILAWHSLVGARVTHLAEGTVYSALPDIRLDGLHYLVYPTWGCPSTSPEYKWPLSPLDQNIPPTRSEYQLPSDWLSQCQFSAEQQRLPTGVTLWILRIIKYEALSVAFISLLDININKPRAADHHRIFMTFCSIFGEDLKMCYFSAFEGIFHINSYTLLYIKLEFLPLT